MQRLVAGGHDVVGMNQVTALSGSLDLHHIDRTFALTASRRSGFAEVSG